MDNENPHVLSQSDLPTRKPRKPRATAGPRILPPPLRDPFETLPEDISSADDSDEDWSEDVEGIDAQEIYGIYPKMKGKVGGGVEWIANDCLDLISPISDPEHPLSLGELAVVNLPHIYLSETSPPAVRVEITPTITHCSLATVIGLGIRVRLERALPPRYRVDVRVREGTHSTADQVNRQLGDKERVAAACENESLMRVLTKMLEPCV